MLVERFRHLSVLMKKSTTLTIDISIYYGDFSWLVWQVGHGQRLSLDAVLGDDDESNDAS